jgi:hypothetical protein
MLAGLGRAFWAPKDMEDFKAMAINPFNDPTVRFGCLINLLPSGAFSSPRNAAHLLVHVKYFIRASLFIWSRDNQHKYDLPMDRFVIIIYSQRRRG